MEGRVGLGERLGERQEEKREGEGYGAGVRGQELVERGEGGWGSGLGAVA